MLYLYIYIYIYIYLHLFVIALFVESSIKTVQRKEIGIIFLQIEAGLVR